MRGQLLAAIKSLYKQSEVCVRLNGMKTKPFLVLLLDYDRAVLFLLFLLLYIYGQNSKRQFLPPVVASHLGSETFGASCL